MSGPIRPTSSRVYLALKRQLLDGDFEPGERIDAAKLSERHAASITPIRAALHHLAGERLVDARSGEGFYAPRVTEAGLRDLYVWNGHIVQLALQLAGPIKGGADWSFNALSAHVDPVRATELLFAEIGEQSGNEHCASALLDLNDRLHLARGMEANLFDDVSPELCALADLIGAHAPEFRSAIGAYHRRRLRAAPEIVRRLYRPRAATP